MRADARTAASRGSRDPSRTLGFLSAQLTALHSATGGLGPNSALFSYHATEHADQCNATIGADSRAAGRGVALSSSASQFAPFYLRVHRTVVAAYVLTHGRTMLMEYRVYSPSLSGFAASAHTTGELGAALTWALGVTNHDFKLLWLLSLLCNLSSLVPLIFIGWLPRDQELVKLHEEIG